jgi:alanine racemase
MAVTLTVERDRWLDHVRRTWDASPGLIPVVKGNGYGFGRERLARLAVDLGASEVAVGTVHEVVSIPAGVKATVLTPALAHELTPALPAFVVPTVSAIAHVDALAAAGFEGPVAVKLDSTMHRYGVLPATLPRLLAAIGRAGGTVHAFALHFPLPSGNPDHVRGVEEWLPHVPAGATVQVSHLAHEHRDALATAYPTITFRARIGTELWHGDKSTLHLGADVIDLRPVTAGDPLGYRLTPAPGDGHVVMASGGTAHGVQPLPDGRSPFHHQRHRLALLEPPHMHTSMLFVPTEVPLPAIGDELDLQRPLTQTWVDRIVER